MTERWLGPATAALFLAGAATAQDAPFLDINPAWSPDGRSLVFESRRHGAAQLFVIGANGVEKIIEIDLNAAERQMFVKSVESVKGLIEACAKIAPQLGT